MKNEIVWKHCEELEKATKAISPNDEIHNAEFFYCYYTCLANYYNIPIESVVERIMAINGVGVLRPPRK